MSTQKRPSARQRGAALDVLIEDSKIKKLEPDFTKFEREDYYSQRLHMFEKRRRAAAVNLENMLGEDEEDSEEDKDF